MLRARAALLCFLPLLATCASSQTTHATWTEPEARAPALLVSWHGADAEAMTPVFHALLDESSFQAMWHDVVIPPGSARRPADDLRPAIDFRNCTGFALTAGTTWNSRGYELRSIERIDGEWHARLDQITYQSREQGDRVKPYGIFVLSRVPGTTIVVEENMTDRKGAPPQWKERGRFTVPLGTK
jgi:hypothetical protein